VTRFGVFARDAGVLVVNMVAVGPTVVGVEPATDCGCTLSGGRGGCNDGSQGVVLETSVLGEGRLELGREISRGSRGGRRSWGALEAG
jgi:hypothetical protein